MTRRPTPPLPDGYVSAYGALYGRDPDRHGLRREWLPDPAGYYRRELGALQVRGDWADARCPFHKDTHASLSVSLTHGGYLCHACGESGGDVLAFHRQRYELGFERAARDLNAWG